MLFYISELLNMRLYKIKSTLVLSYANQMMKYKTNLKEGKQRLRGEILQNKEMILYSISANQDELIQTQKSSSILPITSFKLKLDTSVL